MPVFPMEVSVDKRERCSNFTFNETEILVNLIENRKAVIECKKTDAATNRFKEQEWERITILYNSNCSQFRTTKMLRGKWESLKKTTRRELALLAQEQVNTNGGSEERMKKNLWTDRIAYILGESINGTPSAIDSDRNYEAGTVHDEKPPKDVIPSTSTHLTENISLVVTEALSNNELTTEFKTEDDTQWDAWNPTLIKQPILGAIEAQANLTNEAIEENIPDSSSRRHFTRKKKRNPAAETNKKFSELVNKKLELIQIQIDLLQKESETRLEMERERHNIQMKIFEAELQLKEKLLNTST